MPSAFSKPGFYLLGVAIAVGMALVAPALPALALQSVAGSLAVFGGLSNICRWSCLSSGQRQCTFILLTISVPMLRLIGDIFL